MTTLDSRTGKSSDSDRIQRNLDEKGSSILVIQRGNPANIMIPEEYVKNINAPIDPMNRSRVMCSVFGNKVEKYEFDITDLEIYRNDGMA